MISIAGKTALITGASRGIGQQIAIRLAKLGANLVLHASQEKNLKLTLSKLSQCDIDIKIIGCDLANQSAVDEMLKELDRENIEIDIVYNNAAISCSEQQAFHIDREVWDKLFEVNVYSLMKICNHYLPKMIRQNFGRIVNVTSGIANQPLMAPYAVSKAAVNKYTQDIASTLKDVDVLINLMNPGWVQTDMGGKEATDSVESIIAGTLIPVLLEKGEACGKIFNAYEYKDSKII